MKLPDRTRRQIIAGGSLLVAAAIVVAIVWAFAQQLVLAQRMENEMADLELVLATKEARYDDLVERRAYVHTDTYVEEWAREEMRMARPGEVLIVPSRELVDEDAVAAAADMQEAPESTPDADASLWQQVKAWLFGSDPGRNSGQRP
jgi:cell division protein FtsB